MQLDLRKGDRIVFSWRRYVNESATVFQSRTNAVGCYPDSGGILVIHPKRVQSNG